MHRISSHSAHKTGSLKHLLAGLAVVAAGALIGIPAYAQLEGVLSGTLNSNVNVVGKPAAPQDIEPAAGHAGLTGREMLELQRALADGGYYGGALDGAWGPLTRDALLRYQQRSGLRPTGQADARTLNRLGLTFGAESPAANP